jgi:hypothetical protein
MPAVFEWKRKNRGGEIYGAGTSPESIRIAQAKIQDLKRNMRVEDLEKKRSTFRQSIIPTVIVEGMHQSLQKNGEWIPVQLI